MSRTRMTRLVGPGACRMLQSPGVQAGVPARAPAAPIKPDRSPLMCWVVSYRVALAWLT